MRPAQVLFEVTVAEVTLGRGDEYGIDWHEVGGSVESTFGNPLVADTTVASGLVMRLLSIGTRTSAPCCGPPSRS